MSNESIDKSKKRLLCDISKFTSNRVNAQKGAFLLFGLNPEDASLPIKLVDEKGCLLDENVNHPVKNIHRVILKYDHIHKMQEELKSLLYTPKLIKCQNI